MIRTLIVALLFAVLPTAASAASCPALPHYGAPQIDIAHPTLICHAGYAAAVDDDMRVPRWVAYTLSGPHTLGCDARGNDFHKDAGLPKDSASPSDYAASGYDKGHQAPAEDFEWNVGEEADSFSMANMTPQKPGLNRQQWEQLEETVRGYAWQHGPLSIYVGPVVLGDYKRINKRVAVPAGFWKVLVDQNDHVLGFYMNNITIKKGDLKPFVEPVAQIEKRASIKLPTPGDHADVPALWPVDLTAYRKARETACHHGK